jgi:hypothetical protein
VRPDAARPRHFGRRPGAREGVVTAFRKRIARQISVITDDSGGTRSVAHHQHRLGVAPNELNRRSQQAVPFGISVKRLLRLSTRATVTPRPMRSAP